ncbi:MAG: choice-of-anchor R domain-containing protein, partial [Candidatus Hodarchaeales archaeon]
MNNIKELHFNKSELISILLLSCIFFQILLVGSQPNMATPNTNQPLNEEVLIDSLRGNTPDKFTSDSSSINERSEPQIQEHNQEIESNHTLNYDIGSQSGEGGGSITINDTFNWTGSPDLSTQNGIGGNLLPTEQETSITISTPNLYESEYSYFNISEVVSVSDWRLREDYVGIQGAWQSTSSYEAVAMSFTIEEEYANITAVRLNYAVENSPSGEVYLVNSSGGKPDVRSNNISSIEPMTTSSGWKTHTFKKSILLEKGQTYYVVMNATSYDGTHY